METYDSSSSTFAAGLLGVILIPFIIVWLITIVGMWKTFTKAGKPGWAAIIPFYNYIVMIEIVGKPMWWFAVILLVPCANIVFMVWLINLISKSFGKDEGFTIGLIFLPFIFWPILGFGSAQYLGPSAKEAHAANRFGSDDYQRPFDNNPQV